MPTITSAQAQNHFGHLLEIAQREPVVITRHGRPAAVIVSSAEMADLIELRRRRKQAAREFVAWRRQAKKSARRASLPEDQIGKIVRLVR